MQNELVSTINPRNKIVKRERYYFIPADYQFKIESIGGTIINKISHNKPCKTELAADQSASLRSSI